MFRFAAIMLVGLCLVLWSAAAHAGPLDDAKAGGQVGERIDGYVGAVTDISPDLQALIDKINAKRRAKFSEIAKKQGASVEAVGQITGKKLIKRAAAGEYVMGADGQWRQK